MGLHDEKPEVKLEKKVKDKWPDFHDKTMAMDRGALNTEIQLLAKGIADSERKKQEDDELREARENYNYLNKSYTDFKSVAMDKISFCRNRLRELGEE